MNQNVADHPVLQSLLEEHAYLGSLLDLLRDEASALGSEPNPVLLRDTLLYLAEYPEHHHHPREELVFARLAQRRPSIRKTLDGQTREHDHIHRQVDALMARVMQLEAGKSISRKKLSADLTRFADDYGQHLAEEENTFFPAAARHLREADWQELEQALVPAEDPLFGDRVRSRFRNLSTALTSRYRLARRDLAYTQYLGVEGLVEVADIGFSSLSTVARSVRRHFRDATAENLGVLRDGLKSRSPLTLMGMPARIGFNALRHLAGGVRDAVGVISETGGRLREPVRSRMDILKQVLIDERRRQVPPGPDGNSSSRSA